MFEDQHGLIYPLKHGREGTGFAVLKPSSIFSDLFTPTAGRHDVVSIALKPGKNLLGLSVDGNLADGTVTDIDSLMFQVE